MRAPIAKAHRHMHRLCVRLGNSWKIDNGVRVPDAASPVSARAIFHRKFLRGPPIAGVLHRFDAVLRRLTVPRRFV